MKHIFTIHSHITFLVAYSTIHHLGLKGEDVILLSSNYKVKVGGFRVEKAYQTKFIKWYHKLSHINAPNSHDTYITRLTAGEPFVAYVDLMSYYQKILITHPLCKGFNFIEEGNGAYQAYDDLTDLTWPERSLSFRINHYGESSFYKTISRVFRGYNLRLLSIPYHYMAFVNFPDVRFFCFSNNSYYHAPQNKKVLLRPKANQDLEEMALGVKLSQEVIWIDGSNGRYTRLEESYYYEAVDKAIKLLMAKGIINKKVFVKLRPKENEEKNYLIQALKRADLQVEVLPGYLVLEALFVVSDSCTIVGNLSAALEYAHSFGHKVYSIYSLFSKRPPTFFDRMEGFWKNVESL